MAAQRLQRLQRREEMKFVSVSSAEEEEEEEEELMRRNASCAPSTRTLPRKRNFEEEDATDSSKTKNANFGGKKRMKKKSLKKKIKDQVAVDEVESGYSRRRRKPAQAWWIASSEKRQLEEIQVKEKLFSLDPLEDEDDDDDDDKKKKKKNDVSSFDLRSSDSVRFDHKRGEEEGREEEEALEMLEMESRSFQAIGEKKKEKATAPVKVAVKVKPSKKTRKRIQALFSEDSSDEENEEESGESEEEEMEAEQEEQEKKKETTAARERRAAAMLSPDGMKTLIDTTLQPQTPEPTFTFRVKGNTIDNDASGLGSVSVSTPAKATKRSSVSTQTLDMLSESSGKEEERVEREKSLEFTGRRLTCNKKGHNMFGETFRLLGYETSSRTWTVQYDDAIETKEELGWFELLDNVVINEEEEQIAPSPTKATTAVVEDAMDSANRDATFGIQAAMEAGGDAKGSGKEDEEEPVAGSPLSPLPSVPSAITSLEQQNRTLDENVNVNASENEENSDENDHLLSPEILGSPGKVTKANAFVTEMCSLWTSEATEGGEGGGTPRKEEAQGQVLPPPDLGGKGPFSSPVQLLEDEVMCTPVPKTTSEQNSEQQLMDLLATPQTPSPGDEEKRSARKKLRLDRLDNSKSNKLENDLCDLLINKKIIKHYREGNEWASKDVSGKPLDPYRIAELEEKLLSTAREARNVFNNEELSGISRKAHMMFINIKKTTIILPPLQKLRPLKGILMDPHSRLRRSKKKVTFATYSN